MNLNLGSNTVKYKDFLNVDIRDIEGVDIVDDIFNLKSISNGSVKNIIAHNILEHLASDKTMDCIMLWVSKLKIGGSIEIGVPDGELIFNNYLNKKNIRKEYKDMPWENVIHSIFGNIKLMRDWHGRDAEKYMHHTLFNKEYLVYLLEKAGLKNIKEVKPNHPDNMTFIAYKMN